MKVEFLDNKIIVDGIVYIPEVQNNSTAENTQKENKFSQRSLNSLNGIHPDLVKVMKEAIKYCPADFTITDSLRTTVEQQALYAKGKTVPGGIVTNADGVKNKSNHQAKSDGYGYAVDLYPYHSGKV